MMLGFILWLGIIVYIIYVSSINELKRNETKKYFSNNVVKYGGNAIKGYKDVSKEKLEEFKISDINELKDFVYQNFLEFENAYNDLDYTVMRKLSTKELFHNYYTGITLDLKTGRKRIIKNINKKKVIIYSLFSSPIRQTIVAYIEIEYINYTIDKNGDVISGLRNEPTAEQFEVTLRKDYSKEDILKCPNCGANIIENKCPYCRTLVNDVEFKISNIKRIVKM